MANLTNLYLFITDADQHSAFLHRVEGAIYEQAIALREEDAPSPVTAAWRQRQQWAIDVLNQPARKARTMLPGLLVKANDAGLLDGGQLATVEDNQIRSTVAALVDAYAGYIPPEA